LRLDDLRPGTTVFVDANIFLYHFTGASEECTRFLRRCETGDVVGSTSMPVLLEVLHRLMMVEAVKSGAVRPPRVLEKLRRRPEVVRSLSAYYAQTARISEMGISIRPVGGDLLASSQRVRQEHGLLVGDSLILAAMRDGGVRTLASHDADLRRIAQIEVAAPADV
jgi:predicted nucleic acid-binding protein